MNLQSIKRSVDRHGVHLIRTSRAELRSLGKALGRAVPARRNGPLIDVLKPKQAHVAAVNSLSGKHGLGELPFHTDAAHHQVPPRYVLLRLSDDAQTGTPTEIVRFDVRELTEEEQCILLREVWVVKGGVRRTFYASILSRRQAAGTILRYDRGCMSPASGTQPTGQEIMQAWLHRAPRDALHWEPDMTALIDNWRVLHARPAVSVEEGERSLERIMIAA